MKRRAHPMTPPERGDIVWADFDPAFGHEQARRRPALVMSDRAYNEKSPRVIVCPITGSKRPWPFHVRLPEGGVIEGSVIVDQVRAIDNPQIHSDAVDRVAVETITLVKKTLVIVLGLSDIGFRDAVESNAP